MSIVIYQSPDEPPPPKSPPPPPLKSLNKLPLSEEKLELFESYPDDPLSLLLENDSIAANVASVLNVSSLVVFLSSSLYLVGMYFELVGFGPRETDLCVTLDRYVVVEGGTGFGEGSLTGFDERPNMRFQNVVLPLVMNISYLNYIQLISSRVAVDKDQRLLHNLAFVSLKQVGNYHVVAGYKYLSAAT